jgi:molybdate transport system regulatory protein
MRTKTAKSAKSSKLTVAAKIWLERDGRWAFGLGIAQILQAIDTHGSIKAAAASLQQSYRHVWGRLREAERRLAQPLVLRRVGGRGTRRCELTPPARELTRAFLKLRRTVWTRAQQSFANSKIQTLWPGPSRTRRTAPPRR